jgi:hypothetical protein
MRLSPLPRSGDFNPAAPASCGAASPWNPTATGMNSPSLAWIPPNRASIPISTTTPTCTSSLTAAWGGQPLGSPGQVIVVANCGPDGFPQFGISWWQAGLPLTESGGSGQPAPAVSGNWATLVLDPFPVRVFASG